MKKISKKQVIMPQEMSLITLENAPVGLFEADADGKLKAVNNKLLNLLKSSIERVLSVNFFEIIYEKDHETFLKELNKAKDQNSVFNSELRIKDYHGSIVWVYGAISFLYDEGNNFSGYSVGLIEINTEHKPKSISNEEHELFEKTQANEKLLSEAQRVAKIGNWEWDIQKNTAKWSNQLFEIFEIQPVAVISMNEYFQKIHPDDYDFVNNIILTAKTQKGEFNFQHRIVLQNNVVKHLHCRGTVKVDNQNKPKFIIGTAEDITDLLEKELEVLSNQSKVIKYQSALLNLSKISGLTLLETFQKITKIDAKILKVGRVGIWLFNEKRDAVNCSCLFEQKEDQYNFDIVVNKNDAPKYFKALEENRALMVNDALNDETTSELTEFYLKPLGISSMLDVPIRAHGELLGIVCHEHIGPKRVWTIEEQAFASSIADIIAITIESNNRFLAENELIMLNKKLALVNEHKNQFLSVISHDLRNPISSIISASNILLDQFGELKEEDRDRIIKMINHASKEVLGHFDELVKIAKIEDHASLFNPKRLKLKKEVQDDIKLVSQIALRKNIRIKNEINADVFVKADKIMLKSILQNLLTNAIKYSFLGGEIVVSSKTIGEMEQIIIIDQGIGINSEKQAKLFNSSGITESKKGTQGETGSGLGLKIVKDFVEKHLGNLSIESEKGKGTKVSFTLPISN
jgi:PAS domain S-box-containing protein